MNITILSVTIETKPTTKGSYQSADVAYKNNTFQGKVEGKKVMSFGATAESFKVLALAQPGETYDVQVIKNDKGYNDWVSMSKAQVGGAVQQGVPGAAPSVQRGSAASPAPRSTYETPEERAQRQVFIVRQSSASLANANLSVGAKAPPSVDAVIEVAKKIEAYVFAKEALGGASGFDDVPDLDNPALFEGQPNIK